MKNFKTVITEGVFLIVSLLLVITVSFICLRIPPELYEKDKLGRIDLRLMSVNTTDDLVYDGRPLVIVARVGGTDLHIRIFNAGGKVIFDKAVKNLENEEETKADLADLKKRLSPFPDESDLSEEEKKKIVNSIISIAGLTQSEKSKEGNRRSLRKNLAARTI